MKYIVKGEKVIGTVASGKPNVEDLKSRGEEIIDYSEKVELPAKYMNNKVTHITSVISKEEERALLVGKRMREIVERELKAEGKI